MKDRNTYIVLSACATDKLACHRKIELLGHGNISFEQDKKVYTWLYTRKIKADLKNIFFLYATFKNN